jgi:hypothetical protein
LRRTSDWSAAGEFLHHDTPAPIRSRPDPGDQPLFAQYGQGNLDLTDWRTGAKLGRLAFAAPPSSFAWVGDCVAAGCPNDFGQLFDLRRGRSALLPQVSRGELFFGNSGSIYMLSSGSQTTQLWHVPTGTRLARGRGFRLRQIADDDRRFFTAGSPALSRSLRLRRWSSVSLLARSSAPGLNRSAPRERRNFFLQPFAGKAEPQ